MRLSLFKRDPVHVTFYMQYGCPRLILSLRRDWKDNGHRYSKHYSLAFRCPVVRGPFGEWFTRSPIFEIRGDRNPVLHLGYFWLSWTA